MPRIPTIETQGMPGYAPVTRVIPQARPSLTPIAQGLGDIADRMQNEEFRAQAIAEREAEQARREAKAEVERQEADEARVWVNGMESRLRNRFTERLIAAEDEPAENIPGLTGRLQKEYDDAVAEELKAAPARAKTAAQLVKTNLWDQMYPKVATFEKKSREAKVVGDFEAAVDADQRTLFADHTQFRDVFERRLAYAASLQVPPAIREKVIASTRDKLATSAAAGLVERNPEAVVAAFNAKKLDDPILAALPPERQQTLLHRAQSLVAQKKAQAEARAAIYRAEAREQVRSVIDMVNDGFVPDSRILTQAQTLAKGTPLEARLTGALETASAVQEFRLLPPVEQRAQLNAARAQINTPGGAKLYEKLEAVTKNAEGRLREDAFTYGVQTLGVTPTPFDPLNPVASLAARKPQASAMQTRFGQGVSPLTPLEAEQLADTLKALPPDQKARQLAEIGATLNDRGMIAALARQIDGKDRALAAAMMYADTKTTHGRHVSEIILRGQQAMRDGAIKPDTMRETGWRATIAQEIGDAYPNPEVRSQMIDASYMVLQGLESEKRGASVRQAVRLATGGIIEQDDGSKLPLPYGIDEDTFRKRLAKAQIPTDKVFVGQTPMSAADFLAQLPAASLVSAGQGKYSVKAGADFVKDANGRRLVLDLNR